MLNKRDIIRANLKTTLCTNWETNQTCPFGEGCQYAHGKEELRPRLKIQHKYRTRPCYSFFHKGACSFGENCAFSHERPVFDKYAEERLQKADASETKKRSCHKFVTEGFCPYGENCLYEHTQQRTNDSLWEARERVLHKLASSVGNEEDVTSYLNMFRAGNQLKYVLKNEKFVEGKGVYKFNPNEAVNDFFEKEVWTFDTN